MNLLACLMSSGRGSVKNLVFLLNISACRALCDSLSVGVCVPRQRILLLSVTARCFCESAACEDDAC